MKITKLIILLIVLAIGIFAVWKLQQKDIEKERITRSGQIALMFPELNLDEVMRVEISSLQSQSLLFRKEAGTWEVSQGKDVLSQMIAQNPEAGGERQENPANDTSPAGDMWRTFYRANSDQVQIILDAFTDMQAGDVKTTDTEKQSLFKVMNAIVGTEVIFYDSQMNELIHLFVGDMGSAFQTTIVRKNDSDEIREVPVGLSMTLNQPLFNLRDRVIYRHPPETITSVSVSDVEGEGALSMSLTRSAGVWTGTDLSGTALEIDPEKVDTILDTLGNLSANSFVDMERPPVPYGEEDDDPYGILNPTRVIEFTTSDNTTYSLILGKKDGSTYYAIVDEYPADVFRVSDTVINKISPEPAYLAPGVEMPAEQPDAMNLSGQGLESGEMEIPPEVLEELGL